MKIIGVGMGRTGTTSLQRALTAFGYPAYNMEAVIKHEHFTQWIKIFNRETDQPDWESLFSGYDASVAWPTCFFYKELMIAYPQAKFILTLRDEESWADSVLRNLQVLNSLKAFRFIPRVRGMIEFLDDALLKNIFDSKLDREHMIAVYQRHNQAVQAAIPQEKLLIYQVQQGWEPLCAFLNKPVPNDPFPHENTSGNFKQTVSRLFGIKM